MSVAKVVSLALLLVIFQVQLSFGVSNESESLCPPVLPVTWLEMPPYSIRPSGDSANLQGLFKGTLLNYVKALCCDFASELKQTRVSHEDEITRKLQDQEALIGLPVISTKGRESIKYRELNFTSLVEYPGADFITRADVKNPGTVVTLTVLKSWPLLVVTTIMMAIAGIVVWALVSQSLYFNTSSVGKALKYLLKS